MAIHQVIQSPAILNDADMAALRRFWDHGDGTGLNQALERWREALNLNSSDAPDGHHNLTDLDETFSIYQQVIQASSSGLPEDWSGWLKELGADLRARYEYINYDRVIDLDVAITAIYQQLVLAFSSDSSTLPNWLNNLGIGLFTRYRVEGEYTDRDAAITAYQQAILVSSPDSPGLPDWLSNLGLGLSTLYQDTGELTDLDAAITAYQQAVQASSPDSPHQPFWLGDLGAALYIRYNNGGALTDLDDAIVAYQQAVQVSLSSNDMLLNQLGKGLLVRYEDGHSGELTDLDAAIAAYQQAVQASSPDSPDRFRWLSDLGVGLHVRYEHTGELTDLDAAIAAYQQAVSESGSWTFPWLNKLGKELYARYEHTGELTDLDAAIAAYQQAVSAHSESDWLGDLGAGLHARYEHTGELTDLDAAIVAYQQAVQTYTPVGMHIIHDELDDRLGGRLSNLGTVLHTRYKHTGELTDLDAAITQWEKCWSIIQSRFVALPVTDQLGWQRLKADEIAANLVAAYLNQARQCFPHATSVPRRILEIVEGNKSRLLTQLVGRGSLPLPGGLLPEIATQEQQFLDTLTALDTQELVDHDRFTITQQELVNLSRLGLSQQEVSKLSLHVRDPRGQELKRHEVLNKLENLWNDITHVSSEGTAYVIQRRGTALTWQEFAHLAKGLGPTTALLSFFTIADRALLFLFRAGWRAPRMIEIALNQDGWNDLLERLFREVHCYGPGLRRKETWDQPLHLLFTKAQQHLGDIERLILVPAGDGHMLPWSIVAEHTRWHTSTGQPMPLVTLPALGILPRLRQRPHVSPGPALIVGNPCGDLPYAEAEANAVAKRFATKPLLRAAATKSNLLARFPEATLIHLATHAFFDPSDPLKSGIILADGVLTVREILQYRLQADLLVLSACESGQVGSLRGEELAGLSQAFLQIGVRSLLVSLWNVNDPATAALIQAFYAARQAGADKALALRQAMIQIQQDQRWTHSYYWGAFILVGDWD